MTEQTPKAYRVYSYRWVVLAIYGLATAVIQLMWTTFFSITTEAWKFYGFADAKSGESAISLLSIIFMAGMIVLSIPVMAAFEKFGFKKAVGFGVVLMGVCALLRGFGGEHYTVVVVATAGFAIAQPFLLNSPGLVAGKWFPESERATANSVPLLCSYVGMCVGLLLTPVLLGSGMTIRSLLLLYGAVGAVTAVLFLALVKEKPPTPPCTEEEAVRDSFRDGMRGAMKKRDFVLALIVFFCMFGIFNTFFTMIEPILRQLSGEAVDATQVGIIGVVILVTGVAGSLVISMVSDKDKRRRRLPYAVMANLTGVVGLALFIFAKGFGMMLAAAVLYGFFIVGGAPLLLTFAAEAAYPTSEGTSEGLLMWAGNVAGVVFLAGAGLFGGSHKLLMIVMVCMTAAYIVPLLLAKEKKLNRKESEEKLT